MSAVTTTAPEEPLCILIADDSAPVRMLHARMLRNLGYHVREACDGEEAFRQLTSSTIHMIVSDWMMPELDGPALCRRVRQTDFGRYIYFVLVSTRDTNEDLVEGMEAGADDFLSKPIDPNELRVRMRAGERILKLERRLEERNRHLSEAYERIRGDLDAAALMQRSLLPSKSLRLADVAFEWSFLPSLFVSGDKLNFFSFDDSHVGFYNLDVAGHGVPAAMMSVTLSRMLSPTATVGLLRERPTSTSDGGLVSPANVAHALNEQFQVTPESSMYFTMVYGLLHLPSGTVRLVQAGHTNPILLRSDGTLHSLRDGDPPVGLIPAVSYENHELTLASGDRLFVYSDGITECEDSNGEQFGETRLSEVLHGTRGASLADSLNALEHELRSWRGPDARGFLDDVSILALQYR